MMLDGTLCSSEAHIETGIVQRSRSRSLQRNFATVPQTDEIGAVIIASFNVAGCL
jgi:hypothetical protein